MTSVKDSADLFRHRLHLAQVLYRKVRQGDRLGPQQVCDHPRASWTSEENGKLTLGLQQAMKGFS